MPRAIQTFEVSLKAFIVRDGRALFVRESDTGYWELPGGRIDVGEEWEAHASVLAREMREELGAEFELQFSLEVVTWTRQRPSDGVFQFLVVRRADVISGAPQLSPEHDQLGWFDRQEARALGYPERSGYGAGIEALFDLLAR